MRALKLTSSLGLAVLAILLLVLAATPVQADSILIGDPADPNTGNCFPFGCAPGTRYQQVYSASAFTGPILISAIEFFAGAFGGDTNSLATGSWELYLSTTPFAVNDIDSRPFDDNLGPDNTLFASVVGGVVIPNVWTIDGADFFYNPAVGNLLLDVRANLTSAGSVFLDSRNGSAAGEFSRFHNFGSVFDDWGLVTNFTDAPSVSAPIPEPASVVLLGLGLTTVGYLRRRRPKR